MHMNLDSQHTEQLKKFGETVKKCTDDLTSHIIEHDRKIDKIEEVLFGDREIGEIGMKQKVDEIHGLLIQLKGLKGFFGLVILVGVLIITLKGWLVK